MPKITKSERSNRETVTVKTMTTKMNNSQAFKWWEAQSKTQLANELLSTASFLKTNLQKHYRQAGIWARLYGNVPLFSAAGASSSLNNMNNLPMDRPTMNVIQSCIDTKVSRITQSKPRPLFLTDGGDYKERNLAEQMNKFIMGELFRAKAHAKGEILLRDAEVFGTGIQKVYRSIDNKVQVERKIYTDIMFDEVDSRDGCPRMVYEWSLVDRTVLQNRFPKYRSDIAKAEQAYPDSSADADRTISDQVMVCEAFRLPSSPESNDGRHSIVCSEGTIFDEEYKKDRFPYVILTSSPRMVGVYGQGCPERLMGTQVEINRLLIQMARSLDLITPVWLVEAGSKMPKAHFNNNIGRIQTFEGTAPIYQAPEPYSQALPQQLNNLIQLAYQQEGVSAMNATGKKDEGLDSGAALREADDLQSDRFASLERRYHNAFIDLAYLIIDEAIDIAEETGSYSTIYPTKDGTKEIDLPNFKKLKDNPYILQCMDTSSLPRDPAGRIATITERMQAGIYSQAQGMALMSSLDLVQEDNLMNSGEKRIRKYLDDIIEDSDYNPPDTFMDLMLAEKTVVEYINLYGCYKLEEKKMDMLRLFFTQIQDIKNAAQALTAPAPQAAPQAVPQAPPTSDMLPNGPSQVA